MKEEAKAEQAAAPEKTEEVAKPAEEVKNEEVKDAPEAAKPAEEPKKEEAAADKPVAAAETKEEPKPAADTEAK